MKENRPLLTHQGHPLSVLFYDGGCPMCCGWVGWLLRWDRCGLLRFCPLDSALGRRCFEICGLSHAQPDSLLLIHGSCFATGFVAVRLALVEMGGAASLLGMGLNLVPRWLGDWAYRWVAKRRRRCQAQVQNCAIIRDSRLMVGNEDCQIRQSRYL
jgi:predicted DCC family thiol-disulfide oxidoreductase YuxK